MNFYLVVIALAILFYIIIMEKKSRQHFTPSQTYIDPSYKMTPVKPLYTEEWQPKYPQYDINDYFRKQQDASHFTVPKDPAADYPYGQYLTNTNLVPWLEKQVNTENKGVKESRSFVANMFTRQELAYRDAMTSLYKKKLDKRFKHNQHDTFSPFHSF